MTVWSIFSGDTEYWPRDQQVMVNFRVADLDAMLAQLRAAGVEVDDRVEEQEFGRFGWAVDPEGNRFELWQPARLGREQRRRRAVARDDPAVVGAQPVRHAQRHRRQAGVRREAAAGGGGLPSRVSQSS